MKTFWGVPGDPPAAYVTDTDAGSTAPLEGVQQWGDTGHASANTVLQVLRLALDDDARALLLHRRFLWRIKDRWKMGQPFTLTEADALAIVADIEEAAASNARMARQVAAEPAPVVFDGGLGPGGAPTVWDQRRMEPIVPNDPSKAKREP